MNRVLEPEVMDKHENVQAYAHADFSTVNQMFVDRLVKHYSSYLNKVLDIGCGPADIPIRLVRALPKTHVTAVDASKNMIESAKAAVKKANFDNQISLVQAYLPGLPFELHSFDGIISNSILHHLPEPILFWKEIMKLGKSGAVVCVMDLLRPDSPQRAKEIVEANAKDEHPLLKEDFYNSLLAAFTLGEVKEQLKSSGLQKLKAEIISDRHWLVSGNLR
ncbi:MAG: class I SAM-dependent methyltransferase [Candidatus Melainabacteria bacterium]|nr:class I SAM-dependent methyltransferase [Candidatus Melainabacteria bacterium]